MKLRIDYLPMETALYVAENGKDFEKIVPGKGNPDYDDYIYTATVTPGISRIKLVNISTDVDRYYWTYSDGKDHEATVIGNGDDKNCCIVTISGGIEDGTTMYIEEERLNSEYGKDNRNMYFMKGTQLLSHGIDIFVLNTHQDL